MKVMTMGDETTSDFSMGEIVRSLKRIEDDVKEVKRDVTGLSAGFVPRGEWDIWRKSVEGKVAELFAARAPWWTWAAIIISAASLAFALFK